MPRAGSPGASPRRFPRSARIRIPVLPSPFFRSLRGRSGEWGDVYFFVDKERHYLSLFRDTGARPVRRHAPEGSIERHGQCSIYLFGDDSLFSLAALIAARRRTRCRWMKLFASNALRNPGLFPSPAGNPHAPFFAAAALFPARPPGANARDRSSPHDRAVRGAVLHRGDGGAPAELRHARRGEHEGGFGRDLPVSRILSRASSISGRSTSSTTRARGSSTASASRAQYYFSRKEERRDLFYLFRAARPVHAGILAVAIERFDDRLAAIKAASTRTVWIEDVRYNLQKERVDKAGKGLLSIDHTDLAAEADRADHRQGRGDESHRAGERADRDIGHARTGARTAPRPRGRCGRRSSPISTWSSSST